MPFLFAFFLGFFALVDELLIASATTSAAEAAICCLCFSCAESRGFFIFLDINDAAAAWVLFDESAASPFGSVLGIGTFALGIVAHDFSVTFRSEPSSILRRLDAGKGTSLLMVPATLPPGSPLEGTGALWDPVWLRLLSFSVAIEPEASGARLASATGLLTGVSWRDGCRVEEDRF